MDYKRRSIRLKKYNYYQDGWYFVTICSQNREDIFGEIVEARRDSPQSKNGLYKMKLNQNGKIINDVWKTLPNHHHVVLDKFCIMPNHIHMILIIKNEFNYRGASHCEDKGESRLAPTLGWIIGMFKTECTKQINKLNKTPGLKIFQRNYYEHIIRNEKELNKIREYVGLNPLMWGRDRNNINRTQL